MTKLHYFGKDEQGDVYGFHCPGCGYDHPYHVPKWNWNGSLSSPTFTPSLLVFGDSPEKRCHLFLIDGSIHFLADSHHDLAGQIVDCPDWD